MSIVKLLGFETLGCGCLVGHYRDAGTVSVVTYVEEKGGACSDHSHRRNHAVMARRRRTSASASAALAVPVAAVRIAAR
ncbi:hypothetical protein [Luteitalea sp.]|jgi:hypothetical protein|uniref:hypothetical protein n=1 Tax=Luteitalea sp. TaxID=2004800 RepID=UPI0037C993A7